MEILLLMIIVLLAFIAYKLIGFKKSQTVSVSTMPDPRSTSLNPLFSEKDIAVYENLSQEWQEKVEYYFDLMRITDKKEIEKHHSLGKDISEFVPSSSLKNLILHYSVACTGRNATKQIAERMIEANISVLNGKQINEVSKKFNNEQDCIPWRNLNLDAIAWSDKPEIRKAYEEVFLLSIEYWKDLWEEVCGTNWKDENKKVIDLMPTGILL